MISQFILILGKNVIRLGSWLHQASTLDHDFTNPIVLPKGLTAKRLVLDAHQRWIHASQKNPVFNSLSEKLVPWQIYVREESRRQTVQETPLLVHKKHDSPNIAVAADLVGQPGGVPQLWNA